MFCWYYYSFKCIFVQKVGFCFWDSAFNLNLLVWSVHVKFPTLWITKNKQNKISSINVNSIFFSLVQIKLPSASPIPFYLVILDCSLTFLFNLLFARYPAYQLSWVRCWLILHRVPTAILRLIICISSFGWFYAWCKEPALGSRGHNNWALLFLCAFTHVVTLWCR